MKLFGIDIYSYSILFGMEFLFTLPNKPCIFHINERGMDRNNTDKDSFHIYGIIVRERLYKEMKRNLAF